MIGKRSLFSVMPVTVGSMARKAAVVLKKTIFKLLTKNDTKKATNQTICPKCKQFIKTHIHDFPIEVLKKELSEASNLNTRLTLENKQMLVKLNDHKWKEVEGQLKLSRLTVDNVMPNIVKVLRCVQEKKLRMSSPLQTALRFWVKN